MRTLFFLALVTAGCGGAAVGPGLPAPSRAPDEARAPAVLADARAPFVLSAGMPAVRYPAPDWVPADPARHGLSPAALQLAAQVADAEDSYCLLVIRHGALVLESYFQGATAASAHPSWSIAKSYTATVVGIALDRGDISSLDQSAADFVPEYRGTPRAAITIRHLLSMTSGLEWTAFGDYVQLATFSQDNSKDAVAKALGQPPGTKWNYDNGAVQVLERVIRGATGQTLEAYARAHLFGRLGLQASWKKDPAGNPTAYANVLATCRDHARLGYLYLQRGKWGSEQVLSEAWVAQALAPSQALNRAYGFLFWLNGGAPAIDAMGQPWPGALVPFAPPDLFAARGFGNQFIDVVPSLDLVVVRFGRDPTNGGLDLAELARDAQFDRHDRILGPVLRAVLR